MMADSKLDAGKLWSTTNLDTVIAGNSSVYFGLTTGVKAVKFSSRYFTTDLPKVDIWVYEGISFTGGSTLNLVNRRRILPIPIPTFNIAAGITPSSVVNDPNDVRVLSATQYNATNQTLINVEVDGEDFKWLFRPNESYIIRIQNAEAGAGSFSSSSTFEELIWDK